jgi:anti-sigma28 factor (negative regulator of flagellin synthesis)
MRINDNALGGVDRVNSGVQKQAAAVQVTEDTASSVKVKVDPQSAATASRVADSAAARAERIQQIAHDVRAGAYPIDLDQLAHAIAADELSRM